MNDNVKILLACLMCAGAVYLIYVVINYFSV